MSFTNLTPKPSCLGLWAYSKVTAEKSKVNQALTDAITGTLNVKVLILKSLVPKVDLKDVSFVVICFV